MVRECVTVDDFRSDPMFPRIKRAVDAIKVVAPVDVLVRMDILAPKDLEDWRFGRVPYLERVIHGSLSRLSRLLRILGFHCHDLNMVPSHTAYVKLGKGPRTPLRFTKTREERLEKISAARSPRAGRALAIREWRARVVLLRGARPRRD